jgi:hypothetical protein
LFCDSGEILESVEDKVFIGAGVAQHLKVFLDEVAAFGDVFGCFHLVASEHPNLNVCIN